MEELEKLNHEQLLEIKNRIDCLLSYNKNETNTDLDIKFYYGVISDIYIKQYKVQVLSYNNARQLNSLWREVKKSYNILKEFSDDNIGNLSKVRKQKLYIIAVNCIVDMLIKYEVPVTLKSICKNMDKFPSLIDSIYPEYVKNDCLKFII